MLKILIAPAAFKGTFSPLQVAKAMADGVKRWSNIETEIRELPLSDGGDGTIDALQAILGGKLHALNTNGPLGQSVSTAWLELEHIAVIELASACGIQHLPADNLNALAAHTFGLGQVIKNCLDAGQREIVITVGGSASSDGGTGALAALGAIFADKNGTALPYGAGALRALETVDLSALASIKERAEFKIASDVTNPLIGPSGAAFIFAPQKGADAQDVLLIEDALTRLAYVLEAATGKAMRHLPGTGAAGGTAFGLALALDAEIISGFNWFAELIGLNQNILEADLVISGEGSLDGQSLPGSGKALGNLILLCQVANRPLALLSAHIDSTIDWSALGVSCLIALSKEGKQVSHEDISNAAGELQQRLDRHQINC